MEAMSSRRTFLATAASYGRVPGANDRPRIGVIGNGGRGSYLMKEAMKSADVEIGAVCDIYDARRDKAAAAAGAQARKYGDYRQVLTQNDIDAVIVATPDHWHAAITVDACKAGKDVYVEKPMVHYPKDGQAIVKAARDHKRIVQVGMQGRGMKQNIDARDQYVRSGVMGKVGMARTWYTSNNGYILTPPPGMEKKPEGLDLGPLAGARPPDPLEPGGVLQPLQVAAL